MAAKVMTIYARALEAAEGVDDLLDDLGDALVDGDGPIAQAARALVEGMHREQELGALDNRAALHEVRFTTNFATALDRAAMRRFAVKVTFSPPGDEQKWALFEAALRALEPSLGSGGEAVALRAALSAMPALAPGHFAAAVRGARLLRQIADADALPAQLAAEHAHDPDARRRAGFA